MKVLYIIKHNKRQCKISGLMRETVSWVRRINFRPVGAMLAKPPFLNQAVSLDTACALKLYSPAEPLNRSQQEVSMSEARRPFLLCAVALLAVFLTSCGSSSSSMHTGGQIPVFTSIPPTAAAQGSAYSYQLAATDPSGGTVTYALTTGPTGATISGSTVSWTPTAAQSRASNSFTVTATTSEGAPAMQTWSVSPTGVITVNDVFTYWEPSGPVPVPAPAADSLGFSAVVPQSDGSLTVLKGVATTTPGVYTIPGVPAGNYWLVSGGLNLLPEANAAYWTSTTTFDAGRDFSGYPPAPITVTGQTNFSFNLSGLAAVNAETQLYFSPDEGFALAFFIPPNSQTFSETIPLPSYDWTQVTTAFLTQYTPSTFGPWNDVTLGTAAVLTNLSLNNTSNTITQTLQSGPQTSLDVNVKGSQWNSLFTGAAPATPSSYAAGFSVLAEPFVSGISAPSTLNPITDLVFASSSSLNGIGISSFANCDASGFVSIIFDTAPAILSDQDLGTLQYNDPFDTTWTRAEALCQEAIVPIPVPNSTTTVNFALVNSATAAPSSSPLVPIVGPVMNPTIGGGSLFVAGTLSTATPSLSWTAPTIGAPYGYRISVYVQSVVGNVPFYVAAGSFYTSATSVTLPPLSPGNSYVFAITALADAAANIETGPLRSALPTGFASVVSAPITVSGGAPLPAIRGDGRVVRRMYAPQRPTPASPQLQGGIIRR
jgi:hypothetical protein